MEERDEILQAIHDRTGDAYTETVQNNNLFYSMKSYGAVLAPFTVICAGILSVLLFAPEPDPTIRSRNLARGATLLAQAMGATGIMIFVGLCFAAWLLLAYQGSKADYTIHRFHRQG